MPRVANEERATTQRAVEGPVRAFIATYIDSLDALEVLLLLHAHPERAWMTDEVAAELRIPAASASARLLELRQRGLLAVELINRGPAVDVTYSYSCSGSLAAVVNELADCCRDVRLQVIEVIATAPRRKLRLFVDAFKIRKDD